MQQVAPAAPKIDFTDERLDNGLRLVMSTDRLAPVAAVCIWYDVGSKHEVPGRTGLAHLFEHMMFQGSANVAKGEHFAFIQRGGGTLNATTWLHRTNYFESGPSNQLELYLWLEADRMGGLLEALGQETLDNQRDVVKNEKRQRVDNVPYGTWIQRLQEMVFPEGHPYHHSTIGSMDDLDAATLEDVRAFFRTHYAPNNAVLSIVGDFDPERARGWVQRSFGGIPANPEIPPPPAVDLSLGDVDVRDVVTERVPLPRVYVGFRAPSTGTRENDGASVAGGVLALGDAKGARLHRRLVREKGLAQDVQFGVEDLAGVSLALGWATARPGVDVGELEGAFIDVIESVATEDLPDDEIERVRAGFERELAGNLQRAMARADWLSEHATVFGDPGRGNERLPNLLSVSPDEVRSVAGDMFRPENRATLVFVPEVSA